ncbi:MAG: hypothetical protein RLY89_1576, partial [Bacteroidota bacterium]
ACASGDDVIKQLRDIGARVAG